MNTSLDLKVVLLYDLEITVTLNSFKFIRMVNPQRQTGKKRNVSIRGQILQKEHKKNIILQNVKECLEIGSNVFLFSLSVYR